MESKEILVKWFDTPKDDFYPQVMRVVTSNHPRFRAGSRFDFGYLQIASLEDYTITILPKD